VTIPVGNVRGIPISVAVLARYGADIFLLESLLKINPKLQLEVDVRDRHSQKCSKYKSLFCYYIVGTASLHSSGV